MFSFIKNSLAKVYNSFTKTALALFGRSTIDEAFITELYQLLIAADTGTTTTNKLIAQLRDDLANNRISTPAEVKLMLERNLIEHLKAIPSQPDLPKIILMVGINGSGKTTCTAKLAHLLKGQNKRVLLVAADTFRAAAVEQLNSWAEQIGVEIFIGKENQDPSSVVFDGCKKFAEGSLNSQRTYLAPQGTGTASSYDYIIIDTAGRLQTKDNLMRELEKIRRIITKVLGDIPVCTLLTLDAMLGQNSLEQAKVFHEATAVSGIVLTKLDGTGKGGIVFSVTEQLKLPILYVSCGEGVEALKRFDAEEYVKGLFEA